MAEKILMESELDSIIKSEQQNLFRYACYKTGNAEDAADMVQDVLLRVCSKRVDMASIDSLQSYLYRSVLNASNTYHRSKANRSFIEIEKLKNAGAEPDEDFSEEYRRITEILARIPEEQAEVIRLRTVCGKSFVEIAKILLIPVSTVKSRFKYGIDKIRDEFFI